MKMVETRNRLPILSLLYADLVLILSARFAGSRSLDDRRRRRLATEAGEEVKSTTRQSRQTTPAQLDEEPHLQITHFPLRKIISHRQWKIWAVIMGVFAVNAGVLWGAIKISPEAVKYGPNVFRLIDLQSGRLPSLLCAGCLFLAAETAIFIYWIRSRSPNDFNGSFRVWLWASATFFLLGCVAISQAHLVWSQIVCRLWAAQFPNRATWCWLVPLAGFSVPVFVRMLRDMRASRTSTALFLLAVTACLASIGWKFDLWAWPIESKAKVLAESVAFVVAGWAVFGSMLHHARHVLHVSTDPPEVLIKARAEKRAEKKTTDSNDDDAPQSWWAQRKARREQQRAEREAKREQQRQAKADRLAEKERVKAEQKAAAEQAKADGKAAADQAKADKAAAKEQSRQDALAAKEEAKANAKAAREAEKEAKAKADEDAKKAKATCKPAPVTKEAEPQPVPKVTEPKANRQKEPEPAATKSSSENQDQPTQRSQPQTQPTEQLRIAGGELFDPNKPLTDDMLRGLSKSQKRKIRKAYREAQRQDNAA